MLKPERVEIWVQCFINGALLLQQAKDIEELSFRVWILKMSTEKLIEEINEDLKEGVNRDE